MARVLALIIGCCLLLGSCTQRAICPAFQSAYIYDKDALRKKFSYFQEDSTPKVYTASKNKYLVAEPTPYRKKVRNLQTVEMKPVFVQVPDSMVNADSVSVADLDRAARSVIDSTFIPDTPQAQQATAAAEDSVYIITVDRELRLLKYNGADSLDWDQAQEKYVAQRPAYYVKDVGLNTEQDNYMWYLRDHLVLPDVKLARLHQAGEKAKESAAKPRKDKKEKKGFFRNLFRKKQAEPDSADVQPPPAEEFDFIDADTLTMAEPPRSGQDEPRRGFFAPAPVNSQDDTTDPARGPGDKRNRRTQREPGDPGQNQEGGF